MNHLNFLLLVFFSLSAITVYNITPSVACHDHERASLLRFKSQLTDPSNLLSSWQSHNCCAWHGIQCSQSLHVVSLDLRNPNPTSFHITMNSDVVPSSTLKSSALNGTISSSLFHLSHLTYLDLSFNNFMFSRIPPGIANLSQLSYLNLSNAMFTDSITTQFWNLTNLKRLDLSCSSAVPDFSSVNYNLSSTLSISVGVVYSYLSAGYLSSPKLDWLHGMINLRALVLTGVDLSEAARSPQWAEPISGLYSLRSLLLSSCRLSGEIPVNELLNVTQLSFLGMDFNSFHYEIPAQFANLTSLSVLDLTNSNLQGGVPYLPQLDELYVGNCNLSIDLSSMFSLPWPRLEVLDIRSTHVVSHIPPSIANATSLVSFTAYNCLIQGPIPPSLTNLSKLEILKLDFNKLTGQLPSSFFTMRSLLLLSVMQNSLEGSIPASVCNMTSLRQLSLSSNSLTGKLPHCIGRLPNLRILMVSINFLTGTIP
ncbi:LRR receptor-like serine/threonine-protein kinase FLS2 [Linum perenne]